MTDQKQVSTNEIVLVGVHREDDGAFVFTDANGAEHRASAAEGLWKALTAIYDDASIPRTEVPAADSAAAAGIVGIASKEVESYATEHYGSLIGKVVGVLAGNGARKVVGFMQRNSRQGNARPVRR